MTLHELVAAAARRDPQAPAVITSHRTLSYTELDGLAEAVAERLRGSVRPEELVAVALDKGWEQIVAVLGVLKAGAAYLPLSADLPEARLRQLVELGRCSHVLTQASLLTSAAWPADAAVSTLEGIDRAPAGPAAGTRDSLAYVMFTSGSTGTPKGVMVEHGGVADTVLEINRRFGVGPRDRSLALTSLSFDLSVYEIFGPLAAGGAVVVPDPERAGDPAHWAELMERHGVSLWHTVPALLEMLVSWLGESGTPAPGPLRLAVLSGDWIPVGLPDRVRDRYPAARVVSMGGATETSINSLIYEIGDVDPSWTSIPYGDPLPGEGCLLLDDSLAPVPAGTAGELCITGTGLARGYWDDPRQTEAAFVRHSELGVRMYRTGDRARVRPDGTLEFLGRSDLQVKIHGFRVELGEIEAALRGAADVDQAVAVALGPKTARDRVVAFVTPGPHAVPDEAAITAELAARLPGHLVPQRIHVVAALPLTANGKVDRAALAATAAARTGPDAEPPRPGTEQQLADILTELLGRPVADRSADFFELGGNSLLSVQFVTRLRRRLGLDIPLGLPLRRRTIAGMAEALAGLPAVREAAEPRLAPRADTGPAPVSFGQEQVMFLDQLAGGDRAYHFQCVVRFRGELRPDLVQRALTEVTRRHEILRTTFHLTESGPIQVVHDPAEVPLHERDLRGAADADREAALTAALRAEFDRDFDLATGPLAVWTLIRLAQDDWALVETEHHLVHDGWSVSVFWREVGELYSAWADGREPELADLPVQFADYAAWQRGRYAVRRGQVLPYWTDRLAGAGTFDLAVSRQRPPKQTFRGTAIRVAVPDDLYARLRECGRDEGVSLFVVMFAGFAVLMNRYSGARDLTIGSWLANRDSPETENLLGMLVNMVGMRLRLDKDLSFQELLGQTRDAVLEALAHGEAPFEDVVRSLDLPRDPSRNALVQTCFSFHDSPVPSFDWPGARGTLVEHNNGSAKFDLNVVVIPRAEQLRRAGDPGEREKLALMWEFNTDLIDQDAAQRMVDHYLRLLSSAVDDPSGAVDALDMLVPEDRTAIAASSGTARDFPVEDDVVALIARQAAARPDAPAVTAGGRTLTYAELRARADGLAGRLAALGIGPGHRVGLCVDRSVSTVVGLVGVLLTGAAFVPLDHRHPAARNEYVLDDADVKVIVTTPEIGGRFPGRHKEFVNGKPGPAPEHAADPGSEAYVLYTSGSTGRPKGVRVPRRALAGLLASIRARIGFTEADTLLAVTTLAFDISLLELLLPLVSGGQVVIADERSASDGEALVGLLARHSATVMQATPLTWRMLVAAKWWPANRFTALCGGEAMPADLAAELVERAAVCWNLYGPTETTIWSTAYRLHGGESPVPIGTPLANTLARVLDDRLRPVPPGLPGQLYLGGTGVADGYTAAGLTEERFTTLPGEDGRFYRTGDVVRLRSDGGLEFLNRADRQLKLRGYRIEPTEIEQVLLAHPAVADCAVEPKGDPARLIGYVVKADAAVTSAELTEHLAAALPAYMVPQALVDLDRLPLSPSGKLDRAALPEPGPSAGTADPADRAPLTGPEREVATLWSEVLGGVAVGPDDDFFEIGGHSLLALRLVSRVRAKLGGAISVDTVFDFPTVRSMTAELGRTGR
ncbi:amino acid adenylation domain-containing protein [Kitasatospora sp. HPMI-4]|uniref:amino acid adenylation domain-containing protein n=1 Tax=Kitasatospora sp. HPMI-4 TaxID=3448443 RepID=UPI003F197393